MRATRSRHHRFRPSIPAFAAGVLLAFACVPRLAEARDPRCTLQAIARHLDGTYDSSVELEVAVSKGGLAFVTTPNGLVGGLLQKGESLPPEFLELARRDFRRYPDPERIPWDSLSPNEQYRLLRDVSVRRNQQFYADRQFHGLVTRKVVDLTFKEPTRFLGVEYPPGTHRIKVAKTLQPKVEYMGPNEIANAAGFELHFRGNQTAGEMSDDAATLVEGAGLPRVHQHVHIVGPAPLEKLAADRDVYSALLADFVRRANLAAEMTSIVQQGERITEVRIATDIYFGSLTSRRLGAIGDYFRMLATGVAPSIGDKFKIAWVGVRGTDRYDRPGLWGLEYRAVSRNRDRAVYRELLDSLQRQMHTQEYGMAAETMEAWLARTKGDSPAKKVASAWYNRSWGELASQGAPAVRDRLGGISGWLRRRDLEKLAQDNHELKMLAHNWLEDPLVFQNQALAERIAEAQARALGKVLDNGSITPKTPLKERAPAINAIVADFLLDSGLYEQVLQSVGTKMSRTPH